jgi:hypothetical protein
MADRRDICLILVMNLRHLVRLFLLLPLFLAACGDLPEPFKGNPGATARLLAVPVNPMLAIPAPENALLDPGAAHGLADRLATGMQNEEIPALVHPPGKSDWRLIITAGRSGDMVVPRYAVQDSTGKEQGAIDGTPVPAAVWTAGMPAMLDKAADDGIPRVLALMTTIRRARDLADPDSLLNRVAKLYVPPVTGAPGDGNEQLTRLIRLRLADLGSLVQSTPEGADFVVKGTVSMTPVPVAQQRVEIVWSVNRPSGVVSGKVSQLNAIPAGSLDSYWGEVADVVTREASDGINRVVERFIGRDPDKKPAAK